MKYHPLAEKLADLIEANPECEIAIDNDSWYITDGQGNQLATSNDYQYNTHWYSESSSYGVGIAEAMCILLNRKGFKIQAIAV